LVNQEEIPQVVPSQPSPTEYQTTTRTSVPIPTPVPAIGIHDSSNNPYSGLAAQENSRTDFLSNPFLSSSGQPSNSMSNFLIPGSGSYRGQYQTPTAVPTVSPRGEIRSSAPSVRNDQFSSQYVPYNYDRTQQQQQQQRDPSPSPRPVSYNSYPPQSTSPASQFYGSGSPTSEAGPNIYRPGTFDPTIYSPPQNLAPAQYYQGVGPAYGPDPTLAAQGDIYAQAHSSMLHSFHWYMTLLIL
jgi:hypothetical protein